MRLRIIPLLLAALPVLFTACRDKEKEVWTLQKMAGSRSANISAFLEPLDSIVGEPALRRSQVNFRIPSDPASLTLGSDESVVTLRFNHTTLQYLEIPLRQMAKIGKVAYLDLTESPLHLKYPSKSEDFDVVAILKSSKVTPDPKNGPYSVEFQTQAGTLRIRLKMELICTPKPGVKREKQHYSGTLFIDVLPKS